MNILILGSGGREHALAWRLAQDDSCRTVYSWPGNAGMSFLDSSEKQKYLAIDIPYHKGNLREVLELFRIDLVIPGAEKFLYDGVSDWCQEWSVPCLGPSSAAATLERSKLFSKVLMRQSGIRTSAFADLTFAFTHDFSKLPALLGKFIHPVIKISGPSLGKGVYVCEDAAQALSTLEKLRLTPPAGIEEGVFVEERVTGKEVSLFFACNGERTSFLGAARDHKRLEDNDQGPNTGGMGAFSPVREVDGDFLKIVETEFLKPTLTALIQQGTPFKGILFLGLMGEGTELNLLEYNVRFGDPETQVILPLIEGDLSQHLLDLATARSSLAPITLTDQAAVHVVKTARGYPGLFGGVIEKNQPLRFKPGVEKNSGIFFAGVKRTAAGLSSSGGRVLGATGLAATTAQARANAYEQLGRISFDGEHFRTDIGIGR